MLRLAFSLKSGWFFLAFCSIIGTRRLHKEFPPDPLVHLVVSAATCPKAQRCPFVFYYNFHELGSEQFGGIWNPLGLFDDIRAF